VAYPAFRQHTLVENPHDENIAALNDIEDRVSALFDSAQSGKNPLAAPPQQRLNSDSLAAIFQVCEIARGPRRAPRFNRILRDGIKIALSFNGEP